MRTALERRAAALSRATAPALRGLAAGSLVAGAAGVLLGVAVFAGGGIRDDRLFWIGSGALLVVACAAAAAAAGLIPRPAVDGAGAAFLALLSAFVLWNGVSVVWSIEPDRSWAYFNRGLVYVAFAALGLLVGTLLPRRAAAAGLALLYALVTAWALAGKVAPGLGPATIGKEVARLRSPVGYWNALALLFGMALPLALWLAARPEHRDAIRAGGAVFVYALVVALLLTYSRGGVAVGVVAAALTVALARERLETLATLAIATPVGLLVCLWAFNEPGLVDDGQPRAARVRDGWRFGIALALGGALVYGLALAAARTEVPRSRRRALTRWSAGTVAALVIAAGAVVVLRGEPSRWLREFRNSSNTQVTAGHGRLTSLSSNNRWTWWKEAWHGFTDQPVKGTGAGTFELTHRLLRRDPLSATEPHDLPLQFLSETGAVGFVLAAGAALAAFLALARALRGLEGAERAAAAALAVAVPAYLLHGLVDFDWDFVAVTAPLFFVLGLLIARAPGPRGRAPLAGAGVVAATLAAFLSLGSPWLSARRVDAAYAAYDRNDLGASVAAAKSAHSLDPFSLDPLLAQALAEEARGHETEAERLYVRRVDLQPLNSEAWYDLGVFELDVRKDARSAYDALNRAYTLDPWGPAGERGGPLDQARRIVNSGG